MPNIITTIYTQKNIGDKEVGKEFFKLLESVKLLPDKIGFFEPLKETFTLDKAIEMWSQEEPGCYENGLGMIGNAGSMIGKTREPNFRFDVQWWMHPNKKSINNIRFYMSQKTFTEEKDVLLVLFKKTIQIFDAIYGYIYHEVPQERQHVTGTIDTRLPGVFWCNFFGNKYVNSFGKERLLSFPWYQIDVVDTLGMISFLAEYPQKELLISDEIEKKAQLHFGSDSFGNLAKYMKNPQKIQPKNVPSLE